MGNVIDGGIVTNLSRSRSALNVLGNHLVILVGGKNHEGFGRMKRCTKRCCGSRG